MHFKWVQMGESRMLDQPSACYSLRLLVAGDEPSCGLCSVCDADSFSSCTGASPPDKMYESRGFTGGVGSTGCAARAAAICCSRSVSGGFVGSGVPDFSRKFSSNVGTIGTPAPMVAAAAGSAGGGV